MGEITGFRRNFQLKLISQGKSISICIILYVVYSMKIYHLTIGINEEMEEVEFIQEEQYHVDPREEVPDPVVTAEAAAEDDDFHQWIKKLIRNRFNIVGRA